MSPEPPHAARRSRLDAAVAAAFFAAAAAVRLAPWNSVFRADGVVPFESDAFYHLRRILYSVLHFPKALTFDPFLNFPHGGQPIWPPTFDWLLAGVFRVLPGPDRPETIERVAMFVPPLIGAITVATLYCVVRRTYARGTAAVAAGVLTFLPAHFYYSQLGFLDHHVLVALVSLGMLAATLELLREPAVANASGFALRPGRCVALGLAMAAGILVWPGCLIHVAIVQIGLVARLLTAADAGAAIGWSRRLALVHLVACLVVLPFSAGNEWVRWGHFSPLVLSDFQPLYFGAAAACFGLAGELWRRGFLVASRAKRAALAATLAASLVGAAALAIPELLPVLSDAWSWLAKEEAFQSVVRESEPLFSGWGSGGRLRAVRHLTGFVYAVPFAIAFCGWRLRRRADRLFAIGWAAALFAATLNQWRFMNSYAIAHALLIAITLDTAYRMLAPVLARTRIPRRFVALVALAAAAWIALPAVRYYEPFALRARQLLAGREPRFGENVRKRQRMMETARWIRAHTPVFEPPVYSVLGPWEVGHLLTWVAQRPVVQDNFGDDVAPDNFERAEAYFAADGERAGLTAIEPTRARYVLVSEAGSGHSRGYVHGGLYTQLLHLKGSRGRWRSRSGGSEVEIPALERHRLVYESPPLRPGRAEAGSFYRLYEIVPGAEVVGRADPGAEVRAQLPVRSRFGEPFTYTTATRADPSGDYALRVPYSNGPFSPDVRVGDRYTLASGSVEATVAVPEEAVREGGRIAGPTLRLAPEVGP